MSLILELNGILAIARLLAEIPEAIGDVIQAIEKLIANEPDSEKKAILEERLAAIKKDSEVA